MIMQFQTLIATSGPVPSVLSISRSVGQKVCILGQPICDFEVSNDEAMISTTNL